MFRAFLGMRFDQAPLVCVCVCASRFNDSQECYGFLVCSYSCILYVGILYEVTPL